MESKHNGVDTLAKAVHPDEGKQVYGCGRCEAQGHRLLKEGLIQCGRCSLPSDFIWHDLGERRIGDERIAVRDVGITSFTCTPPGLLPATAADMRPRLDGFSHRIWRLAARRLPHRII